MNTFKTKQYKTKIQSQLIIKEKEKLDNKKQKQIREDQYLESHELARNQPFYILSYIKLEIFTPKTQRTRQP